MAEPTVIAQVLLLRKADTKKSVDTGLSAWAVFQEVEELYNHDKPRAMFRRFYLAPRSS